MAAAGGLAPPFTDSKSAVLLVRRHRNEIGQGDRTCTCMISLPRGVADCLAPHPDVEIEPVFRHPACLRRRVILIRRLCVRRPARSFALRARCCFLSLADRPAPAIVTSCDEHETNHGEPVDREGNSDHVVVLSVFRALPRRASAVQRVFPERNAQIGAGGAEVARLRILRRAS